MGAKEKLIGLIIIIAGAVPFLLKIKAIGDVFAKYQFLNYLVPGQYIYQIIIILLGVLLLWTPRPRGPPPQYRYR